MKKRIMKLMAGFLAMAMVFAPAIGASAAGTESITITVDGEGQEYQAYKLMDLTTSLKADCGHTNEADHTNDCYNYSYTLNDAHKDVVKTAAASVEYTDTTDADLIAFINGLDAAKIRAFADAVYAGIKDKAADFTSTGKIITVDSQGYYLITESKTSGDSDTRSLVMLDTAGQKNITVTAKEGIPTLTKKVKLKDAADSTYADAVDAGINDVVTFQLTGTFPENIDNYTKYNYQFEDMMDRSLMFQEESLSITIDGQAVPEGSYADNTLGSRRFIGFTDILEVAKTMNITISKDSEVKLTYDAKVGDSVVSGKAGNKNNARLNYSDDPYNYTFDDGTARTVTSKWDTVKVFTFDAVINKIDKDKQPLAGAEFKLYEKNGESWAEVNAASAFTKNEAGTVFTAHGLSQGSYKIEETKVPDGYNKADDVYFDIEAVYETESDDPQLTSLVVKQDGNVVSAGENAAFSVSEDLGTVTGSIVNLSGNKLPSTGELGRAILLYGGIGAVVVAFIAVAAASRRKKVQ